MFKYIFKGIIFAVETISSELAILAAILSTVHDGRYWERIWGGMKSILATIYGIGAAYVTNKGLHEVLGALKDGINQAIDKIGVNIQDNPQRVLLAFVATYVFYKLVAFVLAMIRRMFFTTSSKEDVNPGKKGKGYKGEEYKKLYGEQETHPVHHESKSHDVHPKLKKGKTEED